MSNLKKKLDSLLEQFSGESFVHHDPLGEVRKFASRADREVAGFVAAGFAFGNIRSILSNLREIFSRTGRDIAGFTRNHTFAASALSFQGLKYRWITPRATCTLFHVLAEMLRSSGSIENFFKEGRDRDLAVTLRSFSERAMALAPQQLRGSDLRGLRYFFTHPGGGSACKRLNLFLRWMVRTGPPDLGLWSCLTPAELIVPLDVHVARAASEMGLTTRKTRDWKMACEITESLRIIEPRDPLKYDFALHKLGVTSK